MVKIMALTFALLVGWIGVVHAQQADSKNRFSAGLQLNQYQRDFGAGLNVTSSYFANNKMAVRVRGNVMFHEHVQDGGTTWSPYANTSVGLIGVSGTVQDFMRMYGEGGIIGLFPSSEFSSGDFVFGGYGLFGFEFFMRDRKNYFIEIGGIGTGAKADKIANSPIYSNGLTISTGFRMYF